MSYFLRELAVKDVGTFSDSNLPYSTQISEEYAHLIRKFSCVPPKGHILKIPLSKEVESDNHSVFNKLPIVSSEISSTQHVVGAPSSFATTAIAKALLAKYNGLLKKRSLHDDAISEPQPGAIHDRANDLGKADQLVCAGLICVFDVLRQLSRRDPELCVHSLNSLLGLLQNMPVDSLRNESKSSIESMMKILKQLREEGSPSVCAKASSCLVALAVACGLPEHLVGAIHSLICIQRTEPASTDSSYDIIQIPENLHRLNLKVQQKIYQGYENSSSWSDRPLENHRVVCSFDLPLISINSPSHNLDDDRRLHGSIASDGMYIYVLNYIGLYKLGTGLQETILGKLYASNNAMKATRNCLLTFCNGSLYLRRRQSSCISVIDTDSLRDIGEVILPTDTAQSALFSDGSAFYHASIGHQSTLNLILLNDSFIPTSDSKSKHSIRLSDVSYCCLGESKTVPHQLPLTIPTNLHSQAADLHLGRDIAFLQSRSGKIYYAGNGIKYGLQETGTIWMELVLPENVVQMSVGIEHVLFRSGSGHVWIAGGEDRRRAGKLRRLATVNRRKTTSICSSAGSFAYVTDNGRVYFGGRHGMSVHPETGQILGLDGIHMVSVSLGKTHAVAISKQGHVYTWGLNNLNQCGRIDQVPSRSSSVSPRKGSIIVCAPTEHLWVKDIPSICAQCGLCSARGSSCAHSTFTKRSGPCSCGPGETTCLRCSLCRPCGEASNSSTHRTKEGGTPNRTILNPSRVTLITAHHDVKVSSVSCGNFHTVLLAADGRVFTFGSNCHGQLGTGDIKSKAEPQLVILPKDVQVVQVAAGSNHTVLRSSSGAVYTFGAHKQGQLARPPGDVAAWHAMPDKVPGYGPGSDSFASWIGTMGDSTLIHSHKALMDNDDLTDAQIVASKNDLFIFPRQVGKDYIVIRRKQYSFTHHQLGPAGLYTSWCLEPRFDILWLYNAAEMRVQAHSVYHISTEQDNNPLEDLSFMRCPEYAVPLDSPAYCSSIQLGMNILSCSYSTLTINGSRLWTEKTFSSSPITADAVSPEGYSIASRFEGTGGGWGYSAHSIEAIQFSCNKDIKLIGIGLYGGRGEYIAKIKLFHLLGDYGDEMYVELLTETDETLFDCRPRETAALMLVQPLIIRANHWHVVSAKISGPSSDCGASGRKVVDCDDVLFTFRNSVISNNGTDVNVGQIPELYYQVLSLSEQGQSGEDERVDGYTISRLFSPASLDTVSPPVFTFLLNILDWSLSQVFVDVEESEEVMWITERAAIISLMTMKMLSHYTLLIYPFNVVEEPSAEYAHLIAKLHAALLSLFNKANELMMEENFAQRQVLENSTYLFTSLSHCLLGSRQLICAHLALIISSPNNEVLGAAIVGSIAKKNMLLEIILHSSTQDNYPVLSSLLLKYFTIEQERIITLTSFPNILRFLYDKSFYNYNKSAVNVAKMAQDIVVKLSKDLVISDVHCTLGPSLTQSTSRFRRRSSSSIWDMTDGTPDAIVLRVDVGGVSIHGIGVFLAAERQKKTWFCEVYNLRSDVGEQWELLVKCSIEMGDDGSHSDTGVIRLPEPVNLSPGIMYAVKIWTPENGKTYCGEGGMNYIRLSNGARVTFCSSSMSENGTSVQRGQIPYFLYSLKNTSKREVMENREEIHKFFIMLLRLLSNNIGACLASGQLPNCARSLISRISGHVMVFMEQYPDKALEVMAVLEQLIPMVSNVNGVMKSSSLSESFEQNSNICETKTIQVIVESPHPYKTNTVYSAVVGFDESVDFMCVQFSPSCETSQADDQLWIYLGIERECYMPIGRYYGSRDWPPAPLLLPGNSLWFVLESTAEVDGVTADQMYGFHCTITGYPSSSQESNIRFEQELAWLSASACRILVQLPSDPSTLAHLSIAEDDTRIMLEKHGSLLKKGLSLSHVPTLNELILRGLPPSAQSADLIFLREFISACPSTTSGFLARWLPTGPVVDPTRCQLTLSQAEMVVGKPVQIRLTTKDQFDRQVMCPSVTVEATMTVGSGSIFSASKLMNFNLPSIQMIQQNPFQPVLINKCRYMSISAMPSYLNYSYEEIRLGFTQDTVARETVILKHKSSSTFQAEWTPQCAGNYRVECKVDGFELSHNYSIQVVKRDNGDQDMRNKREQHRVAQLSRARQAIIPPTSSFQGIRMRSSASLIAPSVGIIPRGGTISYIEEIENDDGKWLRLTDETAIIYGNGKVSGQVWCLAYHHSLHRELIPIGSDVIDRPPVRRKEEHHTVAPSNAQQSVIMETNEMYVLGAGQHMHLYSRPSPEAMLDGEDIMGRQEIQSNGWVNNQYGVWIRIAGTQKYLLAENSVGRSSIHSQSYSTNGNDDEEGSPPSKQSIGSSMSVAVRPSVVDCCRAVFAAFLWHEHLVKDAMAAAAYVKFHQNLHNLWSSCDVSPATAAPSALQPIVRLWKEVCGAVQTSVEQHLIMPPSIGKALYTAVGKRREVTNGGCELCEDSFKVPVTVHMRMAHPGCGEDSQGYGYNSSGKFITGWSGDCGSGGRANSTWYLLCSTCRTQYLRKTPAGHRQERTRRWREFRLSKTAFDSRPEIIMKQNAIFLLDLNSSLECDSKASSTATSGWTINLFPAQTPSPPAMGRSGLLGKGKLDTSHSARSSFMSQSMFRVGHASDPGPKGLPLMSPPSASIGPTSSLGQYRTHQSIHEGTGDTQEVLQSPSAALRTLITHSTPNTSAMLKRPVLAFVVEHHNLKRIRDACEQSIRRSVGFSHAFRVWNWLLRLVSSETSVSDIIFQYLTALSSYHRLAEYYHTQQNPIRVLPHPWRLCFLAGPLAGKMVQQLHAFLYTIAVILQSNGVDGKLRSLCFKAWTIQLTVHEQELLILTCNILATVGGVLSEPSISENWISDSTDNSKAVIKQENADVKEMRDITSHIRIEASSRQAMVVCLTDGNPDTFWESGEEDKSRTRSLSVICDSSIASPVLLSVFMDNGRDDAYKTTHVAIRAAVNDGTRAELFSNNIDQNFCGWIKCCIAGVNMVQISLKGPHVASRVRQIVVLGSSTRSPQEVIKPSTSHQLFFNNTQLDAFALFQAISAQAFSGELSEDQQGTLRERVVDLLFSRVQLQPLQNYVCTQVVNALEREVQLLCDQTKKNYSYACGLLAMLVRICESRKGTEMFSARNDILISMSELLIFAPQVVQCQVLHSIERLLPVFTPASVDLSRMLRNILVVVGKVVILQVRDKAAHTVSTALMNTCLANPPPSWRTDKNISPEIGKLTAQLIKNICDGEFSLEWASSMRRELASALLGVIQLSSSISNSSSKESVNKEIVPSIITSKRFWLSVSALAMVKEKSWLKLTDKWSAMQAEKEEEPETLCDNHDDGHTTAQVFCTICEAALCRECFTIMHLHKKNRHHQVQSLDQGSTASEIDIHQGCARMRIGNLLILFHGETLNGLVEVSSDSLFPVGSFSQQMRTSMPSIVHNARCRFCGNGLDGHLQVLAGVCEHEDCRRLSETACGQTLPCGHPCGGISKEKQCLPCLTCFIEGNNQDGDDLCVICFTDRLGAAPCVQLQCGHLFHFHCLRTILEKRWNGPRIHFRFINCPLCNQQILHPGLSDILDPILDLRSDVLHKAKMRLEYDGLLGSAAITDEKSEYFNRPEDYAMDRYMYVLCDKCKKAYFGGESRCQLALDSSQYSPADLICGGCSDPSGAQVCGRHGAEFLEYKCRFCCSIAVYFCFGTTHFCASCHDDFQRLMCLPKSMLPKCPTAPRAIQLDEGPCPLRIDHPPTGEEFAMGCGICRNISTF